MFALVLEAGFCAEHAEKNAGSSASPRLTAVELAFADIRGAMSACEFSVVEPGQSTPFYELV